MTLLRIWDFPQRPEGVEVDALRNRRVLQSIFLVWTWNLKEIGICRTVCPLGAFDVRSSLRADLSLNQEKYGKYYIGFPSDATDLFKLVLQGLSTLGKQHYLLSLVDSLRSERQTSVAHVRLLERQ